MRRRSLRALYYLLWLAAGAGSTVAFAQPFSSQIEAARGRLKLFTTATLPNPCPLGQLVWDLTASTVKVCSDGTNWATAGGSVTSGALTLNTIPKALTASSIGDSTLTDDGTTVTVNTRTTFKATMTGASLTSNFFNITGTFPTVNSASAIADLRFITSAGSSAQMQIAFTPDLLAGYTGSATTMAIWALNNAAGTAAGYLAPNSSVSTVGNAGIIAGSSATTTGANIGTLGATANATGPAIGAIGFCDSGSVCNGVIGSAIGGTVRTGGYFTLNQVAADRSAGILVDNGAVAAPIAVFRDNQAAAPTTGPTATVSILDGGTIQYGLGVLTSATMTAENQCVGSHCLSSYTWTNAQVVALGAALTGDITVATLPAKTQVKNAYVVITGAASGPTTLTVSCGDAIGGTPFINYVVASDAKAAANTVYGDASAERGTSIDTEFFYLPSYTATTLVTCHYIATVTNLNTTTGSTGRVILETTLLP